MWVLKVPLAKVISFVTHLFIQNVSFILILLEESAHLLLFQTYMHIHYYYNIHHIESVLGGNAGKVKKQYVSIKGTVSKSDYSSMFHGIYCTLFLDNGQEMWYNLSFNSVKWRQRVTQWAHLKEYYEIVNEARSLSGNLSNIPSFRAIRVPIASQSTFKK